MRDDEILLEPLLNVKNFSDYYQNFISYKIYDLNPLRDFSFYLDLRFQALTGLSSFHLVNWLLFAGILFFVYRFTKAKSLFLLFAFHPIFVNSVAWISARKHLLSIFFICIALDLLRSRQLTSRKKIGIVIAYLCSILSQPITLWFPIWVIGYQYYYSRPKQPKADYIFWGSLLFFMIACALANQWYYSAFFPHLTEGISKYQQDSNFFDPGIALLAIARSWFQILIPTKISPIEYFPSSYPNLISLALLPICLFYLWKKKFYEAFIWLGLFFLPLLMLNIRPTNVFLSDTYLLLPAIGVYLAIQSIFTEKTLKNAAPILYCIAALFLLHSKILVGAWETQEKAWVYAYNVEATPRVAFIYATIQLKKGNPQEARIISSQIMENYPDASHLYSEALIADLSLSPMEKIAVLKNSWQNTPWHRYTLAALLFQTHQYADIPAIIEPIPQHIGLFKKNAGVVGAEISFFCSQLKKCSPQALEMMEKVLQQQSDQWEKYQERKNQLFKLGPRINPPSK